MHWPNLSPDQWELAKNVAIVIGMGAALAAIGTALAKVGGWVWPYWREWRDRRTLRLRVGAELYDREEIKRATSYYIRPDCQSVDPGGGEGFRRVISAREPLFDTIDRLMQDSGQYKFVILLADSGMGKTSFLLNYYAYHWRSRRRKRFHLSLIPLNMENSDELIRKIPEDRRSETVLCLDALDEDRQAIRDHRQRLSTLLNLTHGFRTVIITCRSQFFLKEEEIPIETGVLKVGPVGPDRTREFYFHKLYLAAFSNSQVERYLKQRFPIWRYRAREEARTIVAKIPDLVVRPMLLAHVPDLVSLNKKIEYSFQIYEAMVAAWLEREKGFVHDSSALREFSERLAANLFVNRGSGQMERIPAAKLKPLADEYRIPLEDWQLRGRSLLNRDALGHYKFAHRSIMEYLFIRQFLSEGAIGNEPWTDLMKAFLCEMVRSGSARLERLSEADLSGVDLRRANLQGADLSGANLSNADLQGANLRRAILRRAVLLRANLRGANLEGVHLNVANLGGADLKGANLISANLIGVRLEAADLTDANLQGADLSQANLRGANLSGTGLSGTDLRGTNFSGIDLRGTDLSGKNLSGARFNAANLSGKNLRGADFSGADFRDADLSGTDFSGTDLRGANFSGIDLRGTDLSGKNLSGARFNAANLSGKNLRGADFSRADFSGADLSGADLSGANFSGANFSGADLSGADLSGANFSGAHLSLVQNLSQAQIDVATGDFFTKLPEGQHMPLSWKK